MRLATHEFIRRFLIHVLPERFHRIRHYGLLASASCKAHIASVETVQLSGVFFCSDSGMLPLWDIVEVDMHWRITVEAVDR